MVPIVFQVVSSFAYRTTVVRKYVGFLEFVTYMCYSIPSFPGSLLKGREPLRESLRTRLTLTLEPLSVLCIHHCPLSHVILMGLHCEGVKLLTKHVELILFIHTKTTKIKQQCHRFDHSVYGCQMSMQCMYRQLFIIIITPQSTGTHFSSLCSCQTYTRTSDCTVHSSAERFYVHC